MEETPPQVAPATAGVGRTERETAVSLAFLFRPLLTCIMRMQN